MPESVAVHKLRGFVHDAKGVVLESLPGLIRVRLGGPGSRYRFKGRRKSWLDLARKSGMVDMSLYMEQTGQEASQLTITVHGSGDGVASAKLDGRSVPSAEVPAKTPLSDALSKDLQKRGFRFVGSTICYALMQATGMVNDHAITCFRYAELAS